MRNRCPSEVAEPTETVPVRSGSSSSSWVDGMRRADVPEGRLDVRTAGACKVFASRPSDGQDGQALLNVAAEGLNMHTGDGLDGGPPCGIQVSECDEVIGEASALVARPGGERRE